MYAIELIVYNLGIRSSNMNFQADWFHFSSVCDKAFTELAIQAYKHFSTYFHIFFVFAVDRGSAQLWPNFASVKENGFTVFSGSR